MKKTRRRAIREGRAQIGRDNPGDKRVWVKSAVEVEASTSHKDLGKRCPSLRKQGKMGQSQVGLLQDHKE